MNDLRKRKIEDLRQHWESLQQKISAMRQQLIGETRGEERFRLQNEIKAAEQIQRDLETQLDELGGVALPPKPPLPPAPKPNGWPYALVAAIGLGLFGLLGNFQNQTPREPVVAVPEPAQPAVPAVTLPPAPATPAATKPPAVAAVPPITSPWTDPISGMEFVKIPPGCFWMGCPQNETGCGSDESPQHKVCFKDEFWLGKTELTQAQWDKVMDNKAAEFVSFKGANLPVDNLSWNEAQGFAQTLTQKQSNGMAFRLPTEAEWEYAARALTSETKTPPPFHTGACISASQANFDDKNNSYADCKLSNVYRQKTLEVASFEPNAFGLHDMHGNLWEWVEDCYHENYQNAPGDGRAWSDNCYKNKEVIPRVLRGGSWYDNPFYLRAANRNWGDPDVRDIYVGARFVVVFPARTLK
jgi:formylglycine-generating enzyme required for sulfatase activity